MIEVSQVTKSYGPTQALRGVTFNINKGEIVGFLGPNGAGKSTTMKILTCFMPADSGTAKVGGYGVFEQSLEVRKRIGYLPESAPLYLEMGVVDFLRYIGRLRGVPGNQMEKQLKKVIEVTGLGPATGKAIGELSKGYRQRVGLAQALIHEPEVLILDEPTSGLDPNQIKDIRDLIRDIGREHTVILSTHILPEVTATCDRAVIISRGQVVAEGTPQELMDRSAGAREVVARIRGPKDAISAALSRVEGVRAVKASATDDNFAQYHIDCAADDTMSERVFAEVAANKWGLVELRQQTGTLEDVFANLTK